MFVLDTNVVSAIISPNVPPPVVIWMAGTPLRFLHTTTVTQAEILAGIAILPPGSRRHELSSAAQDAFENDFAEKIWPFDTTAAEIYADIFAARRRAGLHIEPPDLMIASIALSQDAAVVTRNVGDFDGCGVEVINPWGE